MQTTPSSVTLIWGRSVVPQGLKQAQDPPGAEPGLTFRAGRQRSMERRQARSSLVSQPPEMSLLHRQEMQQRCKQGEAPPSAAPGEKWESSSHRAPQGPKNLTPKKCSAQAGDGAMGMPQQLRKLLKYTSKPQETPPGRDCISLSCVLPCGCIRRKRGQGHGHCRGSHSKPLSPLQH